jgi:hypothetical protein
MKLNLALFALFFSSFSTLQAAMPPEVTIEGKVTSFTADYVKLKQNKGEEIFVSRDWINSKDIRQGMNISFEQDLRKVLSFDRKIAKRFGKGT